MENVRARRAGGARRKLRDADPTLELAYMAFPPEQKWRQLHSTNPLERLNKEIRRRSDVVGILPTDASVIRLVGCLLIEQDEEWRVGRRYFSQDSMKKLYASNGENFPALQAGE